MTAPLLPTLAACVPPLCVFVGWGWKSVAVNNRQGVNGHGQAGTSSIPSRALFGPPRRPRIKVGKREGREGGSRGTHTQRRQGGEASRPSPTVVPQPRPRQLFRFRPCRPFGQARREPQAKEIGLQSEARWGGRREMPTPRPRARQSTPSSSSLTHSGLAIASTRIERAVTGRWPDWTPPPRLPNAPPTTFEACPDRRARSRGRGTALDRGRERPLRL